MLVVGLGIIVGYNGPDIFSKSGRYSSHSSNNLSISFASVGQPHLLRRAPCWISQPSLSRFCRIFLEFYHLTPICHLENAEIFDISVIMVLSSSEAHRRREIFEVYVCQRKAIVVSKFAFNPENFFVCFGV